MKRWLGTEVDRMSCHSPPLFAGASLKRDVFRDVARGTRYSPPLFAGASLKPERLGLAGRPIA